MSGTFREVDESQGKHRKALLGIGVLLCLGLGVSLAFVGESAAVDAEGDGLTASSLKDAPLAAPGQVPQGLA